MARFILTDQQGNHIMMLDDLPFDEAAFDKALSTGSPLASLEYQPQGEDVICAYDLKGMTSLKERLSKADGKGFAGLAEKLIQSLYALYQKGKVPLSFVVMDLGAIYVDGADTFRFLLAGTAPDQGVQSALPLIGQLREMAQVKLSSDTDADLLAALDDPFVSLFSLRSYFSDHRPVGAADVQQVGSEAPSEPKPAFPWQGESRQAPKPQPRSFSPAPQPAPPRPVPPAPAPAPASDAAPMLIYGGDEATRYEGAPSAPFDRPAPPAPAPAPRQAPPPPAPEKPKKAKKSAKPPKAPKPPKRRKEKSVRSREPGQPFSIAHSYMILGAALVLWIVIGLVVLALLGGFGLFIYVLLSLLLFAWLISRGKLQRFRFRKRKEIAVPTVAPPSIDSVFNVSIKLCSRNLNRAVEVTIRQQDQMVGSDEKSCPVALPYKGISRKHFSILSKVNAGHTEHFIRDENSRFGTQLNGQELEKRKYYPLRIGDRITLANRYTFEVRSDAY